LTKIDIVGGNMGYDSYKLLNKAVQIKEQMHNNASVDANAKKIAINLENVNWTPYRLIEIGEMPEDGKTYVLKNDHD
jgi:hypothetical protein